MPRHTQHPLPGCRTTVRGRLVRNAELRLQSQPPHAATLQALLTCGNGTAYLARREVGTTPGHVVAAKAALRHLRQGDLVDVYAEGGARPGRANGQPVLLLLGATTIVPVQPPLPPHERINSTHLEPSA